MSITDSPLIKIWIEQDALVKRHESDLLFPKKDLSNVPCVKVRTLEDLKVIPPGKGGCYWIWTNEPVNHKLHKNKIPDGFNAGRIIYNGIAKDNVLSRIKHHLFGKVNEGWSGISMDLVTIIPKSHAKKACSTKVGGREKVAYLIDNTRIIDKGLLLQLFLSEEEKSFVDSTQQTVIYFRNGINILEKKHQSYDFVVYVIAGIESTTYLEFIEKKWRTEYNNPQLCSYISGR